MRIRRVIALLALGAGSAGAQRLAGVVHESASGIPISGAVVSLVDAAGKGTARTVTDRAGAFRLPVDSTARMIQVRRIGFRPRDLPLPDSARGGEASIRIGVERLPQVLDPVRVVSNKCPKYNGTSEALAHWEQARLGFLAAVVARDAAPVDTRMLLYSRIMNGDDIKAQTIQTRGGPSYKPVQAGRTPEDFAKFGYSVVYPGLGLVWEGPDADVLLDESFRDSHCFDMAKPRADHAGQVGIDFEALPEVMKGGSLGGAGRGRLSIGTGVQNRAGNTSGLVDIEGTLWLDPSPLMLRSLEFRYVGRSVPRSRPPLGGVVTFRTADNGVVLIESWSIRTPNSSGTFMTGGEVSRARWPDGTAFARPLARLDGQILEKKTERPVANLRVRLPNTPFSARTDAEGRFSFPELIEGPYIIAAADSTYAVSGFGRAVTQDIRVVAGKPTMAKLQIDSRPSAIKSSCKEGSFGDGADAVVVRMVDGLSLQTRGRIEATLVATDTARSMTRSVDATQPGWVRLCGLVEGTLRLEGVDATGRRGKVEIKTTGLGMLDSVTIRLARGG